MYKKLFIAILLFSSKSIFAQIAEDFSGVVITPYNTTVSTVNVGGLPTGWTEHDYHNNPLPLPFLGYFTGHNWITKEFKLNPTAPIDTVACSVSFYDNGAPSNNWLFTKQFTVPTTTSSTDKVYFTWYGLSESQWDPETYDVKISTTNNTDTTAFATTLFSTNSEPGVTWQLHAVDITAYQGQQVYMAFVHRAVGFFLLIDDIKTKVSTGQDVNLLDVSATRFEKTNTNVTITGTLLNEGNATINDITLEWNDGGTPNNMVLTGINLAPFQQYSFTHNIPFNKSVADEYLINIIAKNINTTAVDVNPSNNTKTLKISTIQNNPVRKVLFEEATGTWCGNCPRGEVAIKHMDTLIKDHTFIPISVHTQSTDPMTVPEYEDNMNNAGKPTCNVDRLPSMHELDIPSAPFQVSAYYYARQFAASPALVTQNVSFNNTTRNVTIVANADFKTKFTNEDLRFASIIVEDSLQGVGLNWEQANGYSGNALGYMYGYEVLPSSIPGFIYNNVGRVLVGGYYGVASSIPSSVNNGVNVNYTFNYTLPTTINANNAWVVTLALNNKTGEVLNATKDRIVTPTAITGVTKNNFDEVVYPNPSIDNKINVSFNAADFDNYNLQVYTLTGKIIAEKQLGKINGVQKASIELPINTASGEYLLMINNSKTSTAKNILVGK